MTVPRWLLTAELQVAVLATAAGLWLYQHGHHKSAATVPAAPVIVAGTRAAIRKFAERSAAAVVVEAETLVLRTLSMNSEVALAVANFVEKLVANHFPQLANLQPELSNATLAVATLAEKAAVTYGGQILAKLIPAPK